MKIRLHILTYCLLFVSSKSFCQKDTSNCIKPGKFIVEVNYGFPYLAGTLVKAIVSSNTSSNQTISYSTVNSNHLGARFEYIINKSIGVGVEYTYASVSVREVSSPNAFNVSLIKQRALARVTFHFIESQKGDIYAVLGGGYKVYTVKSNDPTVETSNALNLVPVACRFAFGFRFFVVPIVGLHGELGIGGPLIQMGLSLKL